MDGPGYDFDSDEALPFDPGWGPYMVISGWALLLAAPTLMVMGARDVARIHGDVAWLLFILACLLATVGGMTLLVHNHRLQPRRTRAIHQGVPARDVVYGFGLLGILATMSFVVFVVRWLR